MTRPTRYLVFGGGCYGSFYVGQLVKAHARGRLDVVSIQVLDRDPDCRVAREHRDDPRVEIVTGDWHAHGRTILTLHPADGVHWVPAPLAPHAAFHWMRELLDGEHVPWPAAANTLAGAPPLPFAATLPTGSMALSHAPGMCPIHCIEPRRCPLTRDARDWQMRDTVQQAWGEDLHALEIVECVHHAFGVGTIAVAALQQAARRLRAVRTAATRPALVAVATVSACHGIVDLMRVPPADETEN